MEILLDLNTSALQRKIESSITTVSSGFKKLEEGGFDFNKAFSGQVDMASIAQKILTPANMIAMFSVMVSTGIVAALQSQVAGASSAGAAGLTATLGGAVVPQIASGAQTILSQIGSQAGGLGDTASALADLTAYVEQYGGSAQDAMTVTTELGQALSATGGTFSTALQPFLDFLSASGAETVGQIEEAIANLMSAAQASGGKQSIADVATNLNTFADSAKNAGVSFQSINQAVVEFGAEAGKMNLQDVRGQFDLMAQALQGNATALVALKTSQPDLVKVFNIDGANTAFIDMNKSIQSLPVSLKETLASALGIPESAVLGAQAFLQQDEALQKVIADLTVINGPSGLQKVTDQFNATDSATRELEKLWNSLSQAMSDFFTSPLSFLSGGESGNLTTTQFSNSDLGSAIVNALNNLSVNKSGNNLTVTVNAAPGTSASVTKATGPVSIQNQVNGLAPTSGSSSTSNTSYKLSPFLQQ